MDTDELLYKTMLSKIRLSKSNRFWTTYEMHAVMCKNKEDAKQISDFLGWIFPSKKSEHGRFYYRRKNENCKIRVMVFYACVMDQNGYFLGAGKDVAASYSINIVDEIAKRLPGDPDTPEGYWTDGKSILCPSRKSADCVADFLQMLNPKATCNIEYYDPNNDQEDMMDDKYIGYACVNIA